jgi:beta-alanine degradation protein BauB
MPPSPTAAQPTLLAEDDRARITRWDFAPGAATGWHEHRMDYAVVILTDGTMAFEAEDGTTELAVKAGDSYLRPKGVRHDVRNAGAGPLAFVEIEMKS